VSGSFLCKSDKLQPEQSLVVHVKSRQAPSIVNAFVSNPLTVECQSDPILAEDSTYSPGAEYVKITRIINETSYPLNDVEIFEYKVVADRPSEILLSCEDGNGTAIWTKYIRFIGT
jgi:hypothetical protein